MRNLTRKNRLFFWSTAGICALYFAFLHPVPLRGEFGQKIENVQCKNVWDFMADFNNLAILNPEMKRFEILDEAHGLRGEWSYGVLYTEFFEYLPSFLENSAIGMLLFKKQA